MLMKLASFAVALLAAHAVEGTSFMISGIDTGSFAAECKSRCAVTTNLNTQYPTRTVDCTSACQAALCTQSNLNSAADCLGCQVAYNANASLSLGQTVIDDYVSTCGSDGHTLSNVVVTAAKSKNIGVPLSATGTVAFLIPVVLGGLAAFW
ncbi:hypothetical protein C8J56DRAFT_917397 [Mycena floridula]|nr:hypothetical protein C8J56DRAFT_917397 [Mycena floridula]